MEKELRYLAKDYNQRLENKTPEEVLKFFIDQYRGQIGFATSLGAEDQVLTDMVVKTDPSVKIFTLDTGRLFPETYDLIEKTNARFKIKMEVYFPDYREAQKMVNEKGVNLFYHSVENRKLCCHVRKIEPLKRAFHGLEAWICGLRSGQSVTRTDNQLVEWDEKNELLKINPLIGWSEEQVWDYIKAHAIPYNELHGKGYPSIGCQPCTRAIENGEDIRSGRWWWERPEEKECGLHAK